MPGFGGFPPQGAGGSQTLQGVTDEGATTTTAITATGANTFGANGVATTFTGTTNAVIADGVYTAASGAISAAAIHGATANSGIYFTAGDAIVRIAASGFNPAIFASTYVQFNLDVHMYQAKFVINGNDLTEVGTISFNDTTPDTFLAADTGGTLTLGTTDGGNDALFVCGGAQSTATAVVATSDGLTTGLIPANTGVATTTVSTDSDDIVTLPAPVIGMQIRIYVGATGHEVRTVASSGVTINNVDSDGTNELALAASTYVTFECVSATGWIARGFTNLGADLAALVPDAA